MIVINVDKKMPSINITNSHIFSYILHKILNFLLSAAIFSHHYIFQLINFVKFNEIELSN